MTLAANVVSWHAAVFTLAALVVSDVLRLLIERQRQQAFKATVKDALGTSVLVMEHDGLEGRYMTAGVQSQVPQQPPGRS
jgi:hypothetical protein